MNTETKLQTARAAIVRWERKLKLAATKLHKYRRSEARLVKRQAEEVKRAAQPSAQAGRKFDLGE